MRKAGASGLLSVTPYYNKPTQEGLYQHYRAIAESTPLPIVVYNVPGRTGVNVEPATLVRLAALPNIVGVKEASGNITQMCEVCRAVPADFLVLSGDDAMTLPLMAVGGRGVDLGRCRTRCRPRWWQMVEAAERDDFAAARAIHAPDHAADAGQFRRSRTRSGQGGDGGDGPARRGLSAADVAPQAGIEGEDCQGAEGARPPEGALVRSRPTRALRLMLEADIQTLVAAGRVGRPRACPRDVRAACARRCRPAPCARPSPTRRAPIGWRVNTWVKQGILLGFRFGDIVDASMDHGRLPFYDKDTLPLKRPGPRAPASASCPAGPRFATARTSRPASSACRRCT